jgi:hypothetical protein
MQISTQIWKDRHHSARKELIENEEGHTRGERRSEIVAKHVRQDLRCGREISEAAAYIRRRETVGTGKQEIGEPYQRTDCSLTRL